MGRRREKIFLLALSTGLAIGLVFGIVALSGLTWDQFANSLVAFGALPFFAAVMLHAVQNYLSAIKWKCVLGRTSPHFEGPISALFFYTALGSVLANFLTVHVSTITARSLGARFHLKLPISTGAASTFYEQLFDVLVLVVLAGSAVIVWHFSEAPEAWVASMLGAVVICGGGVVLVAKLISRTETRFLEESFWHGRVARFLTAVIALGLLHPKFILQIYTLAVLRYASLMARIYIVILGLNFSLPIMDFFVAFPITQSVNLIAITPGAFGFAEWSWAGVLTAFGVSFAAATALALQLRVVNLITLLLMTSLSAIHVFSIRVRDRRHEN